MKCLVDWASQDLPKMLNGHILPVSAWTWKTPLWSVYSPTPPVDLVIPCILLILWAENQMDFLHQFVSAVLRQI